MRCNPTELVSFLSVSLFLLFVFFFRPSISIAFVSVLSYRLRVRGFGIGSCVCCVLSFFLRSSGFGPLAQRASRSGRVSLLIYYNAVHA